jgi:hypothetical protein
MASNALIQTGSPEFQGSRLHLPPPPFIFPPPMENQPLPAPDALPTDRHNPILDR